jgi:hypothetical protein
MISRCHLPTGNSNPQKRNHKRREDIPDEKGTHRLLARTSSDIVSDRRETRLNQVRTSCEHKRDIASDVNKTQLIQIRTTCEHKRAETSSVTEVRPS